MTYLSLLTRLLRAGWFLLSCGVLAPKLVLPGVPVYGRAPTAGSQPFVHLPVPMSLGARAEVGKMGVYSR